MSTRQKIRFVISYFLAKVALLLTVRRPKWRFFVFEWKYSLANLLNTFWPGFVEPVLYQGPQLIETTSGTFHVRRNSQDAAIVSPAFEAADFRFLYSLLEEVKHAESVEFWDVGANVGAFSVRVGVQTVGTQLRILAFEPVVENQQMLKRNFELNDLAEPRVRLMPFALGAESGVLSMSFSPRQPGDAHLTTGETAVDNLRAVNVRRADQLLDRSPEILIAKIDVEGHERQVLDGMNKILAEVRQCWLCIEDIFDREALSTQLREHGFRFVSKFTPYNSWWHYKSPR